MKHMGHCYLVIMLRKRNLDKVDLDSFFFTVSSQYVYL